MPRILSLRDDSRTASLSIQYTGVLSGGTGGRESLGGGGTKVGAPRGNSGP